MAISKGKEPVARYAHAITLPLTGSGAPTDGTSGTGKGSAGPGSVYVDYAAGNWYLNKGTKASPSWKLVTTA